MVFALLTLNKEVPVIIIHCRSPLPQAIPNTWSSAQLYAIPTIIIIYWKLYTFLYLLYLFIFFYFFHVIDFPPKNYRIQLEKKIGSHSDVGEVCLFEYAKSYFQLYLYRWICYCAGARASSGKLKVCFRLYSSMFHFKSTFCGALQNKSGIDVDRLLFQ